MREPICDLTNGLAEGMNVGKTKLDIHSALAQYDEHDAVANVPCDWEQSLQSITDDLIHLQEPPLSKAQFNALIDQALTTHEVVNDDEEDDVNEQHS